MNRNSVGSHQNVRGPKAATMMIAILLFALVGTVLGDELDYATADSRIIDGHDAHPGFFPWQVSLQTYSEESGYWSFCGGSIISTKFILTAAHCEVAPSDFTVYAGSVNKYSGGVRLAVSQFIVHPEWNPSDFSMDFGLIELQDSIPQGNPNIKPIKLPGPFKGESTQFWGYAVTTGWGIDFYNVSDPSATTRPDNLQAALMYLLTDQACSAIYGSFFQSNSMICAGYAGSAVCRGDSGGPLVQWIRRLPVLVGVTSWTPSSCTLDYPYGWAKVSSARSWIIENTDLNWLGN